MSLSWSGLIKNLPNLHTDLPSESDIKNCEYLRKSGKEFIMAAV